LTAGSTTAGVGGTGGAVSSTGRGLLGRRDIFLRRLAKLFFDLRVFDGVDALAVRWDGGIEEGECFEGVLAEDDSLELGESMEFESFCSDFLEFEVLRESRLRAAPRSEMERLNMMTNLGDGE
jgi:hypothetical protein